MTASIDLDGVVAEVVFKSIRNVHVRVSPPDGRVRVTAPKGMSLDVVRTFVESKEAWIRLHRERVLALDHEASKEYVDGELHFHWGRPVELKVLESRGAAGVRFDGVRLVLSARPGSTPESRRELVERWRREEVRRSAAPLFARYESKMKVDVKAYSIRRMSSRWGSCSVRAGTIRLNTELAKRPPACLEYVVVHEMVHLLEPSHDVRFKALMTQYLPNWRQVTLQLAPPRRPA